jgi:hypothetical protein
MIIDFQYVMHIFIGEDQGCRIATVALMSQGVDSGKNFGYVVAL